MIFLTPINFLTLLTKNQIWLTFFFWRDGRSIGTGVPEGPNDASATFFTPI